MEPNFTKKEKLAGFFIISVFVLLIAVVVTIGRGKDWFAKNVIYYTTFDESYNLEENASVKIYNADIGKVLKITPVKDKVKVKLAIQEDFSIRITTDSIATVKSPTFIGSEYVSIKPGAAENSMIPEGGDILSAPKKSLTDLLEEFEVEKTAKMLVTAFQELSFLAETLRDPDGPFFTALESINGTFTNFELILSEIKEGKGTVGSLLQSRALLDNVHENLDTVKDILDNVAKGSREIPETMRSAREGVKEIRKSVENIDKVVQSLKKNFLIQKNLPVDKKVESIDAGLRD